ncbi:MAG: ATPase [Deltaproteobacteria bacterium]|nr:ATPase [Deltaproteobacteria bacterium]
MKGQSKSPTRRDRLIRERVHDAYKTRKKLPEPTVCPDCLAVFHKGRWQWGARPPDSHNEERCPACHRIHDKYPAGFITLSGQFFQEHKAEIVNLAHNVELNAKAQHPLQRIMFEEEKDDGLLITTTDIHLARGIGEALHRAYHGELDYQYAEEGNILQLSWKR